MAENTNLMSTYLAREALTLKLAPSNLDGTGDSREFSDYGPLTLRFYSANIFTNQPTTYGFLLNIADGTKRWEMHQLWLEQPNGNLYHRGTNATTYNTDPAFKKILDDSNYASILDSVYVNVNGDTMTGSLTFTNNSDIYYQGTKASYRMIRFIDNTTDTYGNGISIGGGGQVIIGGGESANAAVDQVGTDGSEIMYICNDHDVLIHSNMQNGWASRKTWTFDTSGNLIIPASVARGGISTSWYTGRLSALFKMTSIDGYSAMLSLKTTNGTWDIGAYDYTGYTDRLLFTFISDANYNSNSNTITTQMKFGSDGALETPWLRVVNNSSNNTDDATVYIENQAATDWALKISKNGKRYGIYIDSLDQDDALRTNGFIRGRCIWANQGSNGERDVGVDSATSGSLYLYAHTTGKGIYSSGYQPGYVLIIDANEKRFYGNVTGNVAGNATTATTTNYLGWDSRMDYGWNGVNYFNFYGTAGAAPKANDTPTTEWWHILRFNHANNSGFHTDLAIPFNHNCIHYKQVKNGAVQHGGWIKVLDSLTTFSIKVNLTFTNGYCRYTHSKIYATSRVFVTGCNEGTTGVVFSTTAGNGYVEIHACATYNGAGGSLSWSGTKNNINIFVDNS